MPLQNASILEVAIKLVYCTCAIGSFMSNESRVPQPLIWLHSSLWCTVLHCNKIMCDITLGHAMWYTLQPIHNFAGVTKFWHSVCCKFDKIPIHKEHNYYTFPLKHQMRELNPLSIIKWEHGLFCYLTLNHPWLRSCACLCKWVTPALTGSLSNTI